MDLKMQAISVVLEVTGIFPERKISDAIRFLKNKYTIDIKFYIYGIFIVIKS